MIVVALRLGQAYQKCHDPECRDYRSDPITLPESVQRQIANDFVWDSISPDSTGHPPPIEFHGLENGKASSAESSEPLDVFDDFTFMNAASDLEEMLFFIKRHPWDESIK